MTVNLVSLILFNKVSLEDKNILLNSLSPKGI